MNLTQEPWPPLILDAKKPSLMWLRDLVLSVMMWALFALLFAAPFNFLGSGLLERSVLGDFRVEDHWIEYFWRILPYLVMAYVLAFTLTVAAVLTIRRRQRALLLAPPRLLDLAEDARRAGMDEGELLDARAERISVVEVDDEGLHRLK